MNTNIFEFNNNEILMQFNPLFLPTNNFVDKSGSLKTFKLSNSSYLFSDIIKVFVGTDLTQNTLETGALLSQKNPSVQIPAENIFSFNISKNDFPIDIKNGLKNNTASLIGLQTILGMLNKIPDSNQVILGQTQDSDKSISSTNEKLIASKDLKNFLYNLFILLNNNKITKLNKVDNSNNKEDGSTKENRISDEIKSIISQILSSLKNNKPVVINVNNNQETLKLEIRKANIQDSQTVVNKTNNSINSDTNENKNGEHLTKGIIEQTSTINEENTLSLLENENEVEKSQKIPERPLNSSLDKSGEIEKNVLKLVQNGDNTKKNKNVNEGNTKNEKTGILKEPEYSKLSNNNIDSHESDLFNIKPEISSFEQFSKSTKTNIPKSPVNKTFNTGIKKLNDSLSVEDLVASKSSMKGITKVLEQNNNELNKIKENTDTSAPGEKDTHIKIQIDKNYGNKKTIHLKENSFISKSGLKEINKNLNEENDISIKIESKSVKQKIVHESLENRSLDKDQNLENRSLDKDQNLKNRSLDKDQNLQNLTKKETRINQKISPLEIHEKNIDGQVTGKEDEIISNKQQDSKINSSDNVKTNNSGKINVNEALPENDFNENLTNNKQNTPDNTKEQGQFSQSKGENIFSSHMNKIDFNNVQNVRKPVYFSNIGDNMKQIDSSEIVKEISKLASSNEHKNVVLKLMPENLGKVKISLDINKNIIHAHAEVENEAARTLMQNNVDNLRQSLVQQGLELNSLNISLSNQQEQKSNKTYHSKRKPVYPERLNDIDEKEHINISKHYGYNTYEFLA